MKKPVQLFALLVLGVAAIAWFARRKAGGPMNIRDINNNPNLSKTGLDPADLFGLAELFAPKSEKPEGSIKIFTPQYGQTATVNLADLISGNEQYLTLPNGFGAIVGWQPSTK